MSSAHQLNQILRDARIADYGVHGRPLLIAGDGPPDDTADVAWLYIRAGVAAATERLFVWDDASKVWRAVTGVT
jgi:hypothetical protein